MRLMISMPSNIDLVARSHSATTKISPLPSASMARSSSGRFLYLVLPPRGRISPRHALAGGVAVGLLWEATRHILLWYFSTLSVVGVVYGSLATTIIGLLSLEIASIMLLLGAQVIAEYERLQDGDTAAPAELKTDIARRGSAVIEGDSATASMLMISRHTLPWT